MSEQIVIQLKDEKTYLKMLNRKMKIEAACEVMGRLDGVSGGLYNDKVKEIVENVTKELKNWK